ncbi:hypothetical protein NCS56_01307500 [Fusarium sp. Ph1]|nr:hypothetical protein NCS56_01307500 [Fusarium sp. Ph1]
MDPLSIAAGCAGLISTIGTLSLSIHGFVRTCREARKDLDKVSRELQSLQSVLRLIEDDATNEEKPFPPYGQKRLKAQVTWAIGGQGDVEKLRTNLEAHKSSLELALDMHSLTITKDIKADTTEIRNDTTTIRENTEQILKEIVRLQAHLPKDVTTPNEYVLQRFLEEMTTYTEMALDTSIVGSDDDSVGAFYDIEEVSEASVERKRSDGSLATSNKAQLLDTSEAEEASGALAKTSPGGNSTTWPKRPVQHLRITTESMRETLRRINQEYNLQPNRTESPARIPSKDEATAQQRVPSVKEEASTGEHSDTRTREGNARRGGIDEPMEAPVPQSPDGDQGTSNEPQLPSLGALDGVLPQAPVARMSSGGGLVASEEPRPQRYPETGVKRKGLARGFYRRPHPQDNRAESSSPAPSKDKAPAPHSRPNTKEVSASQSSDADAIEGKEPEKRPSVLNEPTIDSSGNAHVKLLNGNLVVDYRYLHPLANQDWMVSTMTKSRENEWGTWRFTAVTCPPRQFMAENYRLRPLLSSQPKPISTILSFELRSSESAAKFAKRWSIIRMGIKFHVLGRDSVIIHVHGPRAWRWLDDRVSTALQEMSINRAPEPPIASVDGVNLFHCYDKTSLWSRKLQLKAGTEAVRIVSTAPMMIGESYRDWATAIGQQLQSKLVINMTEISEDYRSFSNYLQWVQELDKALPHVEDAWGIGLKFVRFDDLIVYLREKGYGEKK